MANFNLQDYETVDQRIQRFYNDNKSGRIEAHLIDKDGDIGKTRWVMRAEVYRSSDPDARPTGVGHAYEVDGAGMANKQAALENCETSAVGRALANAGYSGSKRVTREEMLKVRRGETPGRVAAATTLDELTAIFNELKAEGTHDEFRGLLSARRKEIEGGK
ncbi:hypothetical protein [Corynebacterium heidelbergense]|uniref:Uncharacterized protein n=1 Tax=Corynebacterium heidelbergense TaxID=2055947 RepID=A0A364VDZ7_9CORY|nr:hypothetical protein [Corynebacterium heidelbergense]RAV34882.1 hypothetical protein CWC39_00655 [Corynebacterium heidelbergense]WCZ36018.1 hypothetical protein CHEID_02255 [Corynebacterium heidelbergense]